MYSAELASLSEPTLGVSEILSVELNSICAARSVCWLFVVTMITPLEALTPQTEALQRL